MCHASWWVWLVCGVVAVILGGELGAWRQRVDDRRRAE